MKRKITFLLLSFVLCSTTFASVLYVNPDATGSADGTSWANGFTTISAAITSASSNDTIWVKSATYAETLDIDKPLNLYGGFLGSETLMSERDPFNNKATVNAGGAGRVLTNSGFNTIVEGFILRSGSMTVGGGIYSSVQATFENVEVSNCTAANGGGGVYIAGGTSTFVNCSIKNNAVSSFDGGGVYVSGGAAHMTNCVVFGNTAARFGSAFVSVSGSIDLFNCSVVNNLGGTNGIQISQTTVASSVTASECILVGNNPAIGLQSSQTTYTFSNSISQYTTCTNCSDVDPLFSDQSGGNLTLVDGSPAINASAIITNGSHVDLAGNDRWFGSTIDYGAYEFQGAGNTKVIYVDQSASGANDGTSWVDAYTNLQSAINSAAQSDSVWVKTDTYTGNFSLAAGVFILGGFDGTETSHEERDPVGSKAVLDAQNSGSVMSGSSVGAYLDGFVFQNGNGGAVGGGLNLAGQATFKNVNFLNNSAQSGGGAYVTGYGLFINCWFQGNAATSFDGGALYFNGGDGEMYNCVIHDNTASRFGSAATFLDADVLVQNNTIVGNLGGTNAFQFSGIVGSTDVQINSCILWGNNTVIGSQSASYYSIGESVSQYTCGSCLNTDPLFMDEGNDDFNLMSSSPAIDYVSIQPVNEFNDILDRDRVAGFGIDAGAYEYHVVTGIDDVNVTVGAFPNPTPGLLHLSESGGWKVASLQGTTLLHGNGELIDLSELEVGLYVVTVNQQSFRVMKE